MTTYSAIIISIVFFASVASGILIFTEGLSDKYGIAKTSANFSIVNDTSKVEQKINLIQNKTTTIATDFPSIQSIFDLASLFVFQVGGLLFDIGNIFIGTIANIPLLFNSIPIPTWFTAMLITITLVFLIFAVLGMVFKKEV